MNSSSRIGHFLFALATSIAVGCAASACAAALPDEPAAAAASPPTQHDTVAGSLPPDVVNAYRSRFPGHRIWQCSVTGRGKAKQFQLVVFDPKTRTTVTRAVGSATVTSLIHYHLVLNAAGVVTREDPHPVSANAVPRAARQAFAKWSRRFPRSNDLVWTAHQRKKTERRFSVRVTLNSIEEYGATFKADGTLVTKFTRFHKPR